MAYHQEQPFEQTYHPPQEAPQLSAAMPVEQGDYHGVSPAESEPQDYYLAPPQTPTLTLRLGPVNPRAGADLGLLVQQAENGTWAPVPETSSDNLSAAVQAPEVTPWTPAPELAPAAGNSERQRATPEAERDPEVMTLERGREFLELISRGVMRASRAEQESPAAQSFVQRVNLRGAELAANILGRHTYGAATAREIGAHVQQLQRSDVYLYPQMEMLERPETARPADIRLVMERHAGHAAMQPEMPTSESRVHREDAALAVTDILSGVLEANPDGFRLDPRAWQEVQAMMSSFDALYPDGL